MTFTEQVASGFRPEKNGGSDSTALTLPSGITSGGAASGFLNEVGAVKQLGSSSAWGFTTSAFNVSNKYNDGDGSVQATTSGVFYNFGANATSSSLGSLNSPSGATNDVVTLTNNFGPTYVAWTAPFSGVIGLSVNVWDLTNGDDGDPGFYVITSLGGPTAPLVSASQFVATGGAGAEYTLGSMQSQATSTIGTISGLGALSGYTGSFGLNWTSGTFAVTAGEVLYFVNDSGHDQVQTHGNHSTGTTTDPLALQVQFLIPEPSGVVLLGLAGIGLAATAWKRRRRA
jgi:hypothetical protein